MGGAAKRRRTRHTHAGARRWRGQHLPLPLLFLPGFPAVRGNLTRQWPRPVHGCDLVTAVVPHGSRVAAGGHGADLLTSVSALAAGCRLVGRPGGGPPSNSSNSSVCRAPGARAGSTVLARPLAPSRLAAALSVVPKPAAAASAAWETRLEMKMRGTHRRAAEPEAGGAGPREPRFLEVTRCRQTLYCVTSVTSQRPPCC